MLEDVSDYRSKVFDLFIQRGLRDSCRVGEAAFAPPVVPGCLSPFFGSLGCIEIFVVLSFFGATTCNVVENEELYPCDP